MPEASKYLTKNGVVVINREVRRKDRAVTNYRADLKIVRKAKILHLDLIDGAKAGHKLDLINENACIELETDIELEPAGDNPC